MNPNAPSNHNALEFYAESETSVQAAMEHKANHSVTRESDPQLDVFSHSLVQHIDDAERLRKDTLNSIRDFAAKLKKIKMYGEKTILQLLRIHEFESLSSTLGADLNTSAEHLYTLESHRGAESNRLDVKVFQEFSANNVQEEHEQEKREVLYIVKQMKQCLAEERKAMKSLQKAACTETGGFFSAMTSSWAKKSSSDHGWRLEMKRANWREAHKQLEHIASQLNDRLQQMENARMRNIRRIMMRYVEIQMVFHAKALELLTSTFKALDTGTRDTAAIESEEWAATKAELGLAQVDAAIASFKREAELFDKSSYYQLQVPGADLSASTPNIKSASSTPYPKWQSASHMEFAVPTLPLPKPQLSSISCDDTSLPPPIECNELSADRSTISNASDIDRRFAT